VPSQEQGEKGVSEIEEVQKQDKQQYTYLQCIEIIERFTTEERLRECHHVMNSQKNEAMNRSIMRYAPKEKTYCATMALTSRINMAISIDSLGHSKYYERLFQAMQFAPTELTFSGLRRIWRKKEYGRVYSGSKTVKQRRRIHQREKMIEGIMKMETDARNGMAYSSAIRLEDDEEEKEENCERQARKKAKTSNNPRTRVTREKEKSCKCGGEDHMRTTSSKCPWQGLSPKVVCQNYEQRKKEMRHYAKGAGTAIVHKDPTEEMRSNVMDPVEGTSIPVEMGTGEIVQSTGKFWRQPEILICDTRTHVTHLVRMLRGLSTAGNLITIQPFSSVGDIANVIRVSSVEDAILIAKTEILCLDDISLDGDIADDVSV
jgi:hypothetical protein